MRALMRDVRHSARGLRRSGGYTAAAVLTMALGIGATTAIYGVVRAVLLEPLPFPGEDRVVVIGEGAPGQVGTFSPPDFVDLRADAATLGSVAAYHYRSPTLTGGGGAERLVAAVATPGFFPTLGVAPVLGRGFQREHEQPGSDHVVVLSYGLWRQRFAGDPGVLGRTIELDAELYEVIGVAPQGFEYPADARLWVPRSFSADDLATQRGAHYLTVIGRLAGGVTLESAQAELTAIMARLERAYPDTNTDITGTMIPVREAVVGDVRTALLILLAAVGLVFLIACANTANLGLARATGRAREMAIRQALGAGRARLARSLLVESMLVGLLGGGLGVLLAAWATDLLVALRTEQIPRLEHANVDGAVLLFGLGVSLTAGLLAGLMPALRLSRTLFLERLLRAGGRSDLGARGGERLRSALVVAELALAVLLLSGAGLLLGSFRNLRGVDPGMRVEDVLTFSVSLPDARYEDPAAARAFTNAMLARLEAGPGVSSAAAAFGLPLSGFRYMISVERLDGAPAYGTPGEEKYVQVRVVTPSYFRTLGVPLLRGRAPAPADRGDAPNVVVVNHAAAELLWPGEDALGRTLEVGTSLGLGLGSVGGTVIGVAGDVREFGPSEPAPPLVYAVYDQFPAGFVGFAIHAPGGAERLEPAARAALREVDPELALFGVRSMEQLLGDELAASRFYTLLLSLFAAVALALAAVGIYGVTGYTVGRRTREFGLRLALGAEARSVSGAVLRAALGLALGGGVLGILGAVALTRLLRSLLFGVEPADPATLAAVAALLGGVAVLASWIPARRAARVDPMVALRTE